MFYAIHDDDVHWPIAAGREGRDLELLEEEEGWRLILAAEVLAAGTGPNLEIQCTLHMLYML